MIAEYIYLRLRPLLKIVAHPIAIAVAGSFWLMIAALNNLPLTADEGRWGYQAHIWVHYGIPPYTGSIENKGPGIFILFAISELLFGFQYWGPRLIGFFCMVGTSGLLYQIATKWRDRWAGLIAMAVFLFSCSWKSFHGPLLSQTESFMTAFSTLAFYWIATAQSEESGRSRRLIAAGFFMGWAIAFKQIAIVSAVGLYLFAVDVRKTEYPVNKNIRWKILSWLAVGILLSTILSLVPLWMSGVSIRDYIEGAWLILLNRGSSQPRTISRVFGSISRTDTVFFCISFVYLWMNQKKLKIRKIPITGLLMWMIVDLIGVQAQGWYHGHNFKQILPSLALAVGLSIHTFFDDIAVSTNERKDLWFLATTWLIILLMIISPQMPTVKAALKLRLHPMISNEHELGDWIKLNTGENEFVYMYGSVYTSGGTASDNCIRLLYYSERRSSSRHYNDYFLSDSAIPEVVEDLTIKHPARFIVLWNNAAPIWLRTVVDGSYAYRFNRAAFWVYERRSGSAAKDFPEGRP